MGKFNPPARADSKLRWKTGARFKRTPHQEQNLESVLPQQKYHEGLRELDLAWDQKSPASPVASKEPVQRVQLHFRSTFLYNFYPLEVILSMSRKRSEKC